MSINQTLSLKYIEKAFSATFNFNGQVGGIEDTSNLDVIKKIWSKLIRQGFQCNTNWNKTFY